MSANTTPQPVSFDEFRRLLADKLQIDLVRLTPEATFTGDLMVDSIRLVELMLSLDEMGIAIPMEAAWDVQTVGDAYRVYSEGTTIGGEAEEPA